MKKEEIKIMFASDEAAQLKTITGWVSRDGRYFGNDERLARFAGSTHDVCSCGGIREKSWLFCPKCLHKKRREEYLSIPFKDYDGSPVYSHTHDKYFFDEDDLEMYLEDIEADSIDLVFCIPVNFCHLSYDYWENFLSDDQELPNELAKKVEELNAFIDTLPPPCWKPGKQFRSTYTTKYPNN